MNAGRRTITVDVREDLRGQGCDPFARIMQAVDRLQPGESLRVIAPFEPLPLVGVLARRGFSHRSGRTPEGDWEVTFDPARGEAAVPTSPSCCCAAEVEAANAAAVPLEQLQETGIVDVDARGLEPPQPMVKILESLASLPEGRSVRARTDRQPMHLYAQLEARGFIGSSEEQGDGSFITHIRRA